jgi:hypothetical protein
LEDVKTDKEFLKKMPLRWKKSAAVLACIGIMGTMTFPGVGNSYTPAAMPDFDYEDFPPPITTTTPPATTPTTTITTPQTTNIRQAIHVYRMTSGGYFMAQYFVYFTEQEALNIIRAQLERVGIDFDAEPFSYRVSGRSITLNFSGVIGTIGINSQEIWAQNSNETTVAQRARPNLESELLTQVNTFLATLYAAGLVGSMPETTPPTTTTPRTTTATPPTTTASPPTTTATQSTRMKGDVTGTGKVSITDAVEILRHLAGMSSILDNDPLAREAAKIVSTDKPQINDVVEILRYLAGMDNAIKPNNNLTKGE